jgi:hypothetical protein
MNSFAMATNTIPTQRLSFNPKFAWGILTGDPSPSLDYTRLQLHVPSTTPGNGRMIILTIYEHASFSLPTVP